MAKAGIEPKTAAFKVEAFTTRPTGRSSGREWSERPVAVSTLTEDLQVWCSCPWSSLDFWFCTQSTHFSRPIHLLLVQSSRLSCGWDVKLLRHLTNFWHRQDYPSGGTTCNMFSLLHDLCCSTCFRVCSACSNVAGNWALVTGLGPPKSICVKLVDFINVRQVTLSQVNTLRLTLFVGTFLA